jgi:hypothetical protein
VEWERSFVLLMEQFVRVLRVPALLPEAALWRDRCSANPCWQFGLVEVS